MCKFTCLLRFIMSTRKVGVLSLFISLLVLTGSAFAGMGIFNARITPNEFPIETQTMVKVTAEIGTDAANPLIGSSIALYETDETGKPIRQVEKMYDDGTHGDITASDTIFTTQFPVMQTTPIKKYFQVTAAYKGVRNRYLSKVIQMEIFEAIPVAVLESANATFASLQAAFNNYVKKMDVENARQLVYQDAKANPDITSAELHGEYLSVVYKGRVQGIVEMGRRKGRWGLR